MFKKMMYLCGVVVLLTATQVLVANDWLNTTGDGKWSTAANWSEGIVPTMTPDGIGNPRIYSTGANACTLDGTMPQAVAQWLNIGCLTGTTGTLNVVAGGKLGTPVWGPGETWIGTDYTGTLSGSFGILNIDGAGSIAKSEGWRIGGSATYGGSAIVNITNGGELQSGTYGWGQYIHATGTVNIGSGGIMRILGTDIVIDNGGKINIQPNGKLILNGDQATLVNGLIAQGRITTNSSRCSPVVFYDENSNWANVTSTCTCTTFKTADFNHDCYVDFYDLAIFAQEWLICYDSQNPECLPSPCARLETGSHQAIAPVARSDSWWQQRHADILSQLATHPSINLVFIGDSITQGFDPTVWNQYYASYNPLNLGFSGDMTQNVLWRLENGEITGISPKLAVVLIGTNNTYPPAGQVYSAEQIADGIMAICCNVRRNLPNTKILILAIFPRGEYPSAERDKNAAASILASQIADGKTIYYMDINSHFLDPSGALSASIFPDFIHPNAAGDTIWAEAIKPTIQNLMDF